MPMLTKYSMPDLQNPEILGAKIFIKNKTYLTTVYQSRTFLIRDKHLFFKELKMLRSFYSSSFQCGI
jgi:hypothetical protein